MALRVSDVEALQAIDRLDVERVQAGDSDAFDVLYRRHHDRLLRFCVARLGDRHEAEDVVAEAFARAWRSLPTFAGERRFYPWLRVVAANLCTDQLRRRGRVTPTAEVELPPVVDVDGLAEQADLDTLRSALGRLSSRHRTMLELREHEGLTYEQIAERAGVSLGSVESVLWRARQSLRREFHAIAGSEGAFAGAGGLAIVLAQLRDRLRRLAVRVGRLSGNADHGVPFAQAAAALGIAGLAVASVLAVGSGVGSAAGGATDRTTISQVAPASPASSPLPSTATQAPEASPGAAPAGRPSATDPATAAGTPASPPAAPAAGGPRSSPTRATVAPALVAGPGAAAEATHQPVGVDVRGLVVGANPTGVAGYTAAAGAFARSTVADPAGSVSTLAGSALAPSLLSSSR